MAVASVLNGWLAYNQLDSSHHIDGAFAVGYRLLDNRNEQWTKRFSRFKARQRTAWNAAWAVMGDATPELLKSLGFPSEDVTFIPALSSSETSASPTGVLSVIAQRCATQCQSEFSPELLSKNAHVSLHGQYRSVQDRASILDKAAYAAGNVTTSNVFVLDDLITSGSTLSAIAAAIKASSPDVKVFGLGLAKNERHSYLPEAIQEFPNGHIPSQWERLWHRHDKG